MTRGRPRNSLADGTRIRVSAGIVTGEEVAALVVALDALARGDREAQGRRPPSPWKRAALLEGVGGRAELARPRYSVTSTSSSIDARWPGTEQ